MYRGRPTYANVMSTVAVFIALGGGAYAAIKLPENSVGSKQIKSGAVKSSEVGDGSLVARDFRAGQLPAGAQGPKGDAGPPGGQGSQGSQGSQGAAGEQGETGTRGPTGPQGLQGLKGDAGPGASRIDYDAAVHVFAPTTVLSRNGMEMRLDCVVNGGDTTAVYIEIVSTPAAKSSMSYLTRIGAGAPTPTARTDTVSPNSSFGITLWGTNGSNVRFADGQIIYRSATTTFAIPFHVEADAAAGRCRFSAVATPA
jgi:hypothetical protein